VACVENGRIAERESSRHGPRDPAILPTLLTAVLLFLVRPPKVPLAAIVGLMLFAVALVSTVPGATSWPIKLADGFDPTAPSPGLPTDSWTSGSSIRLPPEERHIHLIGICTWVICAYGKKVRSHCYNKMYKPMD
jgi:hypothetical protein